MATTAVANKGNVWGGGRSPFNASYGKIMMWFFLLSDAFTFSALIIGYGTIRIMHQAYEGATEAFVTSQEYWPIPEKVFDAIPFFHGEHIPLAFVGLMTFILILSSVTMVLAVEAGHRMDKLAVQKWMLWTIFGGLLFLTCQAWEWSHFIHGPGGGIGASLTQNEYGPQAFAASFFTITGFHGVHVFSGVVLLVIVFYNTVVGVYENRGHYEMVEKVGLYWHFVDLVWVFVFTFFYLI